MQSLPFPDAPVQPSRIGLGCMTFGKTWDGKAPTAEIQPRATAAIEAALEAGINCFDHADIYCAGRSEEIFGLSLKALGVDRGTLWIQSKCGIRPGHGFDFRYEHIVASVEGSLQRLGIDALDSLLLHRPDALMEPEEVARAFDDLHDAGKVRFFGVSNQTAGQMELLRRAVRQPLCFNQIQLSILHTQILDEGVDFNRDFPSNPTRNHGCLEYCRLHDIIIQPWGPLAKGSLSGRESPEDDERVVGARKAVAAMAAKYEVPAEAIAVAWLLRHPARMQPLIGTTDPARITNAARADAIELTHEDWYALWIAGRGRRLP